jgi:hypothetical protein
VFVRDRVVFVELKGSAGKLTAAQNEWIQGLQAAGAEVHVFWPKDWEQVQRVLW